MSVPAPRAGTALGRTALAAILGAVVLVALPAAPAAAQQPVAVVPDGATPAATAAGWSRLSVAAGAARTVLVATDADFADALTAGPVQGHLDAPLLLTPPAALAPETAAEITRLGAQQAVVLGGEVAVSEAVVAELRALGLAVERVAGPTRIDTAAAVQRRFFPSATGAVLARAFGAGQDPSPDPTQAFADTIGAGVYTAVVDVPVLLTETERLSEPTARALQASPVDSVTVVGGEQAVSAAVVEALAALETRGTFEDQPTIAVTRVAGSSRFSTATALDADLGYASAADSPRVVLLEGQAPDAWVGGLPAAVQAGNGAAVVLAAGDLLLQPTFDFLLDGGVPLVCGPGVSTTACDKAAAALRGEGEADGPDEEPAPPGEQPPGEGGGPTGTPLDAVLDAILDLIDPAR